MRKRPLIRTVSLKAVITKNLSVDQDVVKQRQDQWDVRHNGASALPKGYISDSSRNSLPTQYAKSIPLSESLKYLQQLAALQAAGILTAEEASAARGRLLGS
ncbi:MAG TPA: hypothetical protein VJ785_04495 [Anaerolineales bacterium]|nr:hypothetical protein [Anaerolineales bacterium]